MRLKKLRSVLKKSECLRNIYHRYLMKHKRVDYNIPEIQSVCPRKLEILGDTVRINLIIPSVNKKHVFGGISTALDFFYHLAEESKCLIRIITTDCTVDLNESIDLPSFTLVNNDEDIIVDKQIVSFSKRKDLTIPVAKNDIFIATAWWTAYNFSDIIRWQKRVYGVNNKLIYLIQDFEPCFYAWSSRYLLSDSTYKSDVPTIAVFNSHELKDYFDNNNYHFDMSYCFDPVINESLKKYLIKNSRTVKRKKQIIVYGRPSVERNAFELIVSALKKWVELEENPVEWTVISAGEPHLPIDLGKGVLITPLGKLSLEKYAESMLDTYMGISLMVSPHPSYPPLEMSTFGIKTITNKYANKDLSSFNDNIISLDSCSTYTIATKIKELADNFSDNNQPVLDSMYFNSDKPFNDLVKDINKNYLSTL